MSEDDWREQWDTVFDHRPGGGRPTAVSADFLRIGVQFADGRRATNLIPEWERPWNRDGRTPPEPSLTEHGRGGSSGDRYLTQGRSLWLWPLPPPEPFDLVIEWPAFKIPVTRTSIDGAAIVAAAQGTEPAWLKPQA